MLPGDHCEADFAILCFGMDLRSVEGFDTCRGLPEIDTTQETKKVTGDI